MSLATEEATFNTAVDDLIAAWETLIDANSANEQMQIAFVRSKTGDNANNSKWGDADDATQLTKFDTGRKFFFKINPDVTGDVPLEVGGRPLFWKVTNDAGDLA